MPKQKIIHQVYFWLHQESDIKEFLTDAVPMLGRCKDVVQFYQGVPAPTEKREVVDHSFHALSLGTVNFGKPSKYMTYYCKTRSRFTRLEKKIPL
jgi:hypothetical protein